MLNSQPNSINLPAYDSEKVMDQILRKFEGNKTVSWDTINTPEFDIVIHQVYYVVENHINGLMGDGMLSENKFGVLLTKKGWFAMTKSSRRGYVAIKEPSLIKVAFDRQLLQWAKLAALASFVSIALRLMDKIFF